ncbi:Golgi pH regulator B, partial [Tulasnella sp. 408]
MDISDGDQSDTTLPQPSTSSARRKPYHFWSATKTGAGQGLGATAAAALKSEGNNSSLARTTFAICFSESCTLFLMVLAQAAHLLSPRAEPTKQELVQAEQSLFRVRSDLLERRREMQKRSSQVEAAAASSESTGWFGRMSFWKGTDAELTSLQREAQGLEVLEREMEKELKELHARKARIEFSKTLKGKAWKWIGWAFGLYCAFRVFSSLINIILPQRQSTAGSTRTPDLIALWLMYLLSF